MPLTSSAAGAIKATDKIHVLIRNGKEIFRGSLKEVQAIGDELAKLADDAARQKYLDELYSKIANQKMKAINKLLLKNQNAYKHTKEALKKLGINIPASANGLAPDFAKTPYLYPATGQQKNIVKIKLTGNRPKDFGLAFKESGIDLSLADDFTWHHLDDFDPVSGTSTLQLVKKDIHRCTFPHLGSALQYDEFYGIKSYNKLKK